MKLLQILVIPIIEGENMSIADKILKYLEYEGPERVVNARQFSHISENRKSINKALERLEDSNLIERIARGYYRLNQPGDVEEIAESFRRASKIPLSAFGSLCYDFLGLKVPRSSLKNTFVSYRDMDQKLTINGDKYQVIQGEYREYGNNLGKVGHALKVIERECSNVHKVLPDIIQNLNYEEVSKLLYHIPRLGSTEIKTSPIIKSMIKINRDLNKRARETVSV